MTDDRQAISKQTAKHTAERWINTYERWHSNYTHWTNWTEFLSVRSYACVVRYWIANVSATCFYTDGSGNATNYRLRPETELSPSRDLVHGTVFLYSSPTAHLLAPLDNISRPIYFIIILEHGTAAALRRLRPSITVSFTWHFLHYWLRQFRRVRRSLDDDAMKTLVHAFITSRVDGCRRIA